MVELLLIIAALFWIDIPSHPIICDYTHIPYVYIQSYKTDICLRNSSLALRSWTTESWYMKTSSSLSVIAKQMHAFQRRALLQNILYSQVHVKEHKAHKGQWMWVNSHAFIAFTSSCDTHGTEFLSLYFLWLWWFPLLLVGWHQTDGKNGNNYLLHCTIY